MGHPKRQRKKLERPRKPYDKERILYEKGVMQKYGLRRKREIWRAEAVVRSFRQRARALLTEPDAQIEKELFQKLRKLGIPAKALEDVLSLKAESLLSRRLQTIVHKKGFASTPKEARQIIVHRHVKIEGRTVGWPGYIISEDDENRIELAGRQKAAKIAEAGRENARQR